MKIRIAAYKEGVPEALKYDIEASEMDIKFDDMLFETPVHVDGIVDREQKTLRFTGEASAKVIRICGRTLLEVKEDWTSRFDWFFEIDQQEYVEPDEQLRELIILDHPMVYRAPSADKPVEYSDKVETKSPFAALKTVLGAAGNKKKTPGSTQPRKKKKK